MIDIEKDLAEAQQILHGDTLLLCEVRHLRALQLDHEDAIIRIAMKLARLHNDVMDMP